MIEVEYEVGALEAELRELFAATVDEERLVEAHDRPWLSRGLEPPVRTVRELRAAALASLLEHAKRPAAERVLTLKEAAPVLEMTERVLRHDVDQGRYDEQLTETRAGLRALRFQARWRTWRLPRAGTPDPRVLWAMVQKCVGPGESYRWRMAGDKHVRVYTRRRDGAFWVDYW